MKLYSITLTKFSNESKKSIDKKPSHAIFIFDSKEQQELKFSELKEKYHAREYEKESNNKKNLDKVSFFKKYANGITENGNNIKIKSLTEEKEICPSHKLSF